MVKRRLCVTISPKLKRRNDLVSVIPLSESVPEPVEEWHHKVELTIPDPWGDGPRWAACDMVATVGYNRLSRPFTKHHVTGTRLFVSVQLDADTIRALRSKVALALGI